VNVATGNFKELLDEFFLDFVNVDCGFVRFGLV
jgi:hypothetical protein